MVWGHQEARPTGAGPGSGTRLLERGRNRAFDWRYRPCANVNITRGEEPGTAARSLTDCGADGLVVVERRHPGAPPAEGITTRGQCRSGAPRQPAPRQPAAAAAAAGAGLLTLVNGVLAGVGGVYVGTHSVLITVIATVVAIALAAMVLISQW